MTCQVQQLRKNDWQRGREIRLRSLADMPDAFGATLDVEEMFPEEKWIERVARQDAATFVALTQDNQDAGLVTMAPYNDEIGLFGMWIDPRYRKKGIGSMLVDAGVRWAGSCGFNRIFLDVGDHNHAAIALYQSRGFLPTGETGTLPSPREHILEHQRVLKLTN